MPLAVREPLRDGARRQRPDIFDDLATLTARALPGGALARALARLNRGLDHWAWSPRSAARNRHRGQPPGR